MAFFQMNYPLSFEIEIEKPACAEYSLAHCPCVVLGTSFKNASVSQIAVHTQCHEWRTSGLTHSFGTIL